MEVASTHLYRSVGFRRLRRIVNEAYLASLLESRYPYSQIGEECSSRGLSIEDFRMSWKSAFGEIVTSREKLAAFEPLRNVTEEEEEKFLMTLSLKRKGRVMSERERQSQPLEEKNENSATLTRLGKERFCKMDKRVCSFLTSNPSALPMVTEIESRILVLYPMGGCLMLDSAFELFLAQGVAQFYGFKSHNSGTDETGRQVLFLEKSSFGKSKTPLVYLTNILSSSMESAFR
ncbi:hypothetical protein Gasu_14850 isoform 2 [Galdieria sulphuraria]|uniref:R3H-associated N-terminal domain-containing protein n=1 Tax=Galdieria sulphuraria TaxID=130081 RepID=M2Y5V4_GALSU|nr:hypothetical protein Gasu_14850 isoform 1 [Galdieria sulphuraria]XP_005707764.1 hypothetical protein Gasu_14850 isoform 2 [Galdieria sulphuraria]EME31243.1 hypothetical protein isoform 1 [Galdieria sulphuraria]EME31244.1 hypothetical protein isoform 2 [Galdieria sulphuraria]|eukprot:XP_005707763.1 hypothetical protein isoform 1 [Galdieria sulphuraria]